VTAAQDWFAASSCASELQRTAVARLLKTSNRYALLPFAAMRTADGWRLGMALDPPPCLDVDAVLSWQPDCDIVLVDPATGKADLVGDCGGWIVGDIPSSANVALYTNGLSFARAWAEQRAAWLDLHQRANVPRLAPKEPQNHGLPGLLLAGPFNRVCNWLPLQNRTRIAVDDPALIRPMSAALLRAKRVPIVETLAADRREVAA
jgi:hypothetical protein